jgi:hypothetical protein
MITFRHEVKTFRVLREFVSLGHEVVFSCRCRVCRTESEPAYSDCFWALERYRHKGTEYSTRRLQVEKQGSLCFAPGTKFERVMRESQEKTITEATINSYSGSQQRRFKL